MTKIAIDLSKGDVLKSDADLIIGIDLGTTYSLVAYIKNGLPVAVKGTDGKNTLVPSILHFAENQTVTVGDEAKQKLISDPANTIFSVKRLLGKSWKDLDNLGQFLGYKIIDDDTESLVKIQVRDKFYTPTELSAEILKTLKNRIEAELNAPVSKAVITVPAYFNDAQRQATRDAGKLAGLDVLRIINEPTAASLAYGLGEQNAQTIAVYDLGGGTFDISILQIQDGIFEVLSTNGDTFLGGDDFDRAIAGQWLTKNNASIEDKSTLQALRIAAEEAKKALSSQESFARVVAGLDCSLTKEELETLIRPTVQRTIACCRQALKDANLTPADMDHIVMVGGSTRIPLVKKMVAGFFGKEVFDRLNPDEVVALGAAIQADVLAGNQKGVLLLDITPLSLGIETMGGLMDVLLPRNSKIPTKAGRQYTTSVDGQKNLKVSVFQGERDLVEHNRKLGEFILRNIPPMPAGLPKIEVQFLLDADGILKVKAKELRSGVEQAIEIRPTYGISEEEMGRMLLESIQNAGTDMAARGLLEARNEANHILLSAEKFVKQNEGMLSGEEKNSIAELTGALKSASEGNDKDAINAAIQNLNDYTTPLAQLAMERAIREAMKGKKIVGSRQ